MSSKAVKSGLLRWSRNRGRNGWDVASDVSEDMTAESMNVQLERNTLGRRRRGSATQAFTGDTITGYNAIYRFVPKAGDAAAEVFVNDNTATQRIHRIAAGTVAANLTLKDNLTTAVTSWATLNGKLYIAYDSAVNRLHVFDPAISTTVVRRAGHATPAAPTVANTGAGAYAATLRYYRVQWRTKNGTTLQRASLLGASVSFTPSGGGTHARVTQPALPTEGETHWAIYGSDDNVLYYELGEVVVGTTTYDDNETPADYDVNEAAPDEGAFTPFPSVKYVLSTGERLIGFGVYETSAGDSLLPKNGRVYFTPVLDTTDYDDDERISNTTDFQGWIDVARNAGGEDRALAGPLDGIVLVFQSRGIYLLVPTGEANQPFRRVTLSTELGAVSQDSTFMGEDEAGRACIYFCDPLRGPYRYGSQGLQWLGYDVQDIWSTVNLAASTKVAAGVYDPELRACLFAIATGANNVLNEMLVFFVREATPDQGESVRGGWVRWAENAASTFRCAAMLPETLGAAMSRTLKPYFGNSTVLNRWNDESVNQDAGTSFAAYVTSRAMLPAGLHQRAQVSESYLQASAQNAVTITQTLTRNFGDETARTATALLTAAGSETRVFRKFEDSAATDVTALQVKLGDGSAANVTWTLDEWTAPVEGLETA